MRTLVFLLGLSLLWGCDQRSGSVTVETGEVPLAAAYRVDLYARQGGQGLVEGVYVTDEGQVTLDSVPVGSWSVLVQAQNGDLTTISHYQGTVEVEEGRNAFVPAGTFRPGLPGDLSSESQSALDRFGPNGEALASALYAPPSVGMRPAQVRLELTSGGTTQEAQVARATSDALARSAANHGVGCATALLPPLPEGLEIQAQAQSRPPYSSIAPGETIDFFIATTFRTVSCQRVLDDAQTQHCLIFAEVVNGQPAISPATAQAVANAFDNDNPFQDGDNGIYQQSRNQIGSEWNTNPSGGRDEDLRVILVFLSSQTMGGEGSFGFFRSQDQFPRDRVQTSNLGEILYINADRVNDDLYDGLATIAHEFSHLILFNEKRAQDGTFPEGALTENLVIEEGMAVLNEQLNGFDFNGDNGGNFFLITSVDNLLQSGLNRPFFQFRGALADYGAGYLLMRYMYDRFGPGVVREITTSPDVGLANVEDKTGVDFREMFLQFVQAVALNGTADLPQELSFQSLDLTRTYVDRDQRMFEFDGLEQIGEVTLPGTLTTEATLQPWGVTFRRVTGGDGSSLSWKATGASPLSTAITLIAGGN